MKAAGSCWCACCAVRWWLYLHIMQLPVLRRLAAVILCVMFPCFLALPPPQLPPSLSFLSAVMRRCGASPVLHHTFSCCCHCKYILFAMSVVLLQLPVLRHIMQEEGMALSPLSTCPFLLLHTK